jgi:hypothetical protein
MMREDGEGKLPLRRSELPDGWNDSLNYEVAAALTRANAKLIAAVFEPLDEGDAARAEALPLPGLAGQR